MLDIFNRSSNEFLLMAGILSLVAALIHIGIILGGADWYRFFGAGERMAVMAEQGSWIPSVVTLFIAGILFLWACYAFSGAEVLPKLPFLKPVLLIISAIYLMRGLVLIPLWIGWPENVNPFWVWSSIICLVYGLCYAIGTYQTWEKE
ncbi:MAG: hypothetical protein Q9N62_03810 [Ghiorsea sp.]|nr:hypothetical protein [Ghiorsea sp.]